jgi:hypothetical protein
VDRVSSELADEQILSDFGACEQDDTAGFAINPMHGQEFFRGGICGRTGCGCCTGCGCIFLSASLCSFPLRDESGEGFFECWLSKFLFRRPVNIPGMSDCEHS